MIDEKKIELMKKLQRLAERGVGGEKEGAQKRLQQLMKKYDIEESDLSDDKLEDHEWKYHNDFELRLLKQTIYKVLLLMFRLCETIKLLIIFSHNRYSR